MRTMDMGAAIHAANARADAAEKLAAFYRNERDFFEDALRRQLEASKSAEAEAARLRGVLQKVEAWFVSEGGPIEYRWENGDIGDFEDVVFDWDEVLGWVRDLKTPLGPEEQFPSIVLYREIYAALQDAPDADGIDARREREGEE